MYTNAQLDMIDALVAEKVMGWRRRTIGDVYGYAEDPELGDAGWIASIHHFWFDVNNNSTRLAEDGTGEGEIGWKPTRDGNAMLEAEAAMRASGWWYDSSSTTGGHAVEFSRLGKDSNPAMVFEAVTLPIALCLAALKAVGVNIDAVISQKEEA